MAMDPQQRAAFVDSYTRLLITTWSSDEFASRVETDLRGALAEVGIAVPADATLERVRDIPEAQREGGLDVQVEEWERGMETGHFSVHIPDTPQVDVSELTEGDLEGVAAGYYCCCCCPCCCCSSA